MWQHWNKEFMFHIVLHTIYILYCVECSWHYVSIPYHSKLMKRSIVKSLLIPNAEFPRDPWVSSWEVDDEMREGDSTKKDEGGAYERHLWLALVKCACCHITENPDDPERYFIVSSRGDSGPGMDGRCVLLGGGFFNQGPLPRRRPSRLSLMCCHRGTAVSSRASHIILYLQLSTPLVIL